MSLSKEQFIKNSAWTLLELTLYPLLVIIATPVFIKNLGIAQYGLWMLVNTITLGMNVLNIGVGDTNIRLISKFRAQNNQALIKRVFNFNFSLSLFLCFVAIVVGFIFYEFNFISVFYKADDYSFAKNILFLANIITGLKFVEISILSVFKAFERFDINSRLVLLSKNSLMIANLLLVTMGYGLLDVFKLSVVIIMINIVIQLVVLNFFEKKLISFPNLIFFKEKLDDLNYNFWYWLQNAVGLLGFLADKLVVAYFTDVSTLGYYSIASLIGIQIHNFFHAFGSFIFPRVSFKLAENKGVDRVYFIARSLIALPGWGLILFLIIFGDVIFRLWLGTETYDNSIYFIKLYLVYSAGILLIIVPYYFINGTRQIKLNSLFELVMRSTHFLAGLSGYYLAGVNGIVYGLILSTFVNIPFQYYYFHNKVIGINSYHYLLVIVPVVFMFGLITFTNVLFLILFCALIIISCKFIYFDPAKQYSKKNILFNSLFNRIENK